MPQATEQFDFFVSYARSDNEHGWITQFVEELLAEHRQFAAGRELKPFFDKQEITTGADWQHTLSHGIAHSSLFVAFISPNYFASEWCRKEWRAWIDTEIAKHILTAGVRPVYIIDVPGLTGKGQLSDESLAEELSKLITQSDTDRDKFIAETPQVVKHLRRRQLTHNQPFCDVHSFYKDGIDFLRRADLRLVLSQLAKDLDHHADLLVKADASVTTVPPYNKNFTGRLDELLAMREQLDKDDRTGVIYGVHGLGGIGKTELALTYAHGYASAYPGGRFLISCDDKSSLREAVLTQSDFTVLFNDRISDDDRKQPEIYFAALCNHLRERLETLGHVLLLLDNVTDTAVLGKEQTDALTKLGPKLHLLATTRLVPPAGNKEKWISLDRLPDEDALELLEKHRSFANKDEREAAQKIVKQLGGFTLAVELIAAWLAANQSSSYSLLSSDLQWEELEEIAEDEGYELRRHNHERRLSAVLAPVLESLKPIERRTLEYAAMLPPDHVPLPWLKELVANDFPEIGKPARLKDPWASVWQKLEQLSLFSRSKEETTELKLLRAHRLVQELVLQEMSEELADTIGASIHQLVDGRCDALDKTTQWSAARWELEPLGALAKLVANYDAVVWAAYLLNRVGNYHYKLAQWGEAEPLLRQALAIREQNYGPDHFEVAESLNDLANLLSDTNQINEAESLYRRALAMREQSYGPDHPDVALSLNNLAIFLKDTNRFDEAEPLYRRTLAIREQSYGPGHPDVVLILITLAIFLKDTNRFDEAEPLYRRALAITEQSFGPDHPGVALSLNNLAIFLKDTNRFDEAEPLYRRALAINEQSYGPDHPDVALSLNNLAFFLNAANRITEAEPLLRRALVISEQSFGPEHLNLESIINNLTGILECTNRTDEAEQLMRRAVLINEQHYAFGTCHPDVAYSYARFAYLLKKNNKLNEAETFFIRAISIHEQIYGPDHPEVADAIRDYCYFLKESARFDEAESLYRQALAIYEQCYYPEHPSIISVLKLLASVLQKIHCHEEAESLLHRAESIEGQNGAAA